MGQVAGVVTEVSAGRAQVVCGTAAHAACATCGSVQGCGWQRAGSAGRLELASQDGARRLTPGDTIEIHVDEARLLGAACRLYLPPLAGLLAGPTVVRLAGLDQGLIPLLGAALGLGCGLLLARRWTRTDVPVRWQAAPVAFGTAESP